MKHLQILLFGLLGLFSLNISAQQFVNDELSNYVHLDPNLKLIICHEKLLNSQIEQIKVKGYFSFNNSRYTLVNSRENFASKSSFLVAKAQDTFQVFITKLPLIKLTTNTDIVNEPKTIARLSYADQNNTFTSPIAIELRGNSALKYPKKSYDLEFRADTLSDKSVDYSMANLRLDDDWILNSLYNEPIKIRSYLATKLWLDVRQFKNKPNSKTTKLGADVSYVEVFLDNSYQGIYTLTEPVDRKQLGLEKIKGDSVYGELFKANSNSQASAFKTAPEFNNIFPHWGGFQVKYPYEDYTAHWDNIYEFVQFVCEASPQEFNTQIETYLDLDNAIDYFLLMNLLRATDNWGKNYFLAKKTKNAPYFFVPWDLDGVMGIIQDGKRIPTTNDILSNNLFDRLLAQNPANYKANLKKRWQLLRKSLYANENLRNRVLEAYQKLNKQQIYTKENLAWQQNDSPEENLDYIKTWLKARLTFLDTYFNQL